MKIIFLDVDGELTYSDYDNSETSDIDVEKVKLLKEICDRTGAKVVISSSWRGNEDYTPRIYLVLRRIFEEYGVDVIGDCPYIDVCFVKNEVTEKNYFDVANIDKYIVEHGTGRAAEVEQWLNEHPDTESYVILDDEDHDWKDYGMDKNWVRPTWFGDGGLKREHVEAAVRILNNI